MLAGGAVAAVIKFVLGRPPVSSGENFVKGTITPIHTDGDLQLPQWSHEVGCREVRTPVGVPDRGLSTAKRCCPCHRTKAAFERTGKFLHEDKATVSVHDGHLVKKAAGKRYAVDIATPDGVQRFDGYPRSR